MSRGLAGEELLRERMSEARAPRLPCTVEKSVHALRGMFYLNRTLSITVPNLNSLARKKKRKRKRHHADVLLYFYSKLYVAPFPLVVENIASADTPYCTPMNCMQTHIELLDKLSQFKAFDLSVHSTKDFSGSLQDLRLTVYCY